MKSLRHFASCFCMGLLLLGTNNSFAASSNTPQTLDQVVAVVNNEVITQTELNKAVSLAEKQLLQANTPLPDKKQMQKQLLNQLINRKLELQTASRMGITLTDVQLNQALENIAKKNNITTAQLKEALESQGINFKDYRAQIKEQMIIQQLLQSTVGANITITEQDIKNAEKTASANDNSNAQYHLRDIVIALPEEPSSEEVQQAYASAKNIMAQLQKGDNFKTVAAANSAGDEALQGGDLGWRTLEELPGIFVEKVPKMKAGEVAGPIRADNGLHIIKLEELKSNDTDHFIVETHVRHILIKTNLPSDDQPARQQLLSIRKQIMSGSDFAVMAEKYSQDAGSAKKGGDIGWPGPGVLVAPFEQAMNSLPVNQISQPVKTSYGWHIIEVLARRNVNNNTQYKKNEVKQMIYQRQFQENSEIWIQQLRNESYIKVLI